MANLCGFTPSREPNNAYVARNLPAAGSTNQSIAKGSAVTMVAGIVVPATAGQDPAQSGYGVVLAVYTTAGRPLTFQTSKIIASAGVGRVDVCFDPNQTYYVRCDASVGPSNIPTNLTLAVSADNARTGLSGHSVTIPASASVNDLFKLINIGPFDELGGKGTGAVANQGVEVRWNRHFLKSPTASVA